MSVLVKRILLVNDQNKDMAIQCLQEFGEYVRKLCEEVKHCRLAVLLDGERLQAGTVQVSFEFELPASASHKTRVIDDDSERWFRNWADEIDAICIDSWVETWDLTNC